MLTLTGNSIPVALSRFTPLSLITWDITIPPTLAWLLGPGHWHTYPVVIAWTLPRQLSVLLTQLHYFHGIFPCSGPTNNMGIFMSNNPVVVTGFSSLTVIYHLPNLSGAMRMDRM